MLPVIQSLLRNETVNEAGLELLKDALSQNPAARVSEETLMAAVKVRVDARASGVKLHAETTSLPKPAEYSVAKSLPPGTIRSSSAEPACEQASNVRDATTITIVALTQSSPIGTSIQAGCALLSEIGTSRSPYAKSVGAEYDRPANATLEAQRDSPVISGSESLTEGAVAALGAGLGPRSTAWTGIETPSEVVSHAMNTTATSVSQPPNSSVRSGSVTGDTIHVSSRRSGILPDLPVDRSAPTKTARPQVYGSLQLPANVSFGRVQTSEMIQKVPPMQQVAPTAVMVAPREPSLVPSVSMDTAPDGSAHREAVSFPSTREPPSKARRTARGPLACGPLSGYFNSDAPSSTDPVRPDHIQTSSSPSARVKQSTMRGPVHSETPEPCGTALDIQNGFGAPPTPPPTCLPPPPPRPQSTTSTQGRDCSLEPELVSALKRVEAEINWNSAGEYADFVPMESCHTVDDFFEQIDKQVPTRLRLQGRSVAGVTIDHVNHQAGHKSVTLRIVRAAGVGSYRALLKRLRLQDWDTDLDIRIIVEWA